jgi:outer membrane protein W
MRHLIKLIILPLLILVFSTAAYSNDFAALQDGGAMFGRGDDLLHTPKPRYAPYSNNLGITGSLFSGFGVHYKRFITPMHAAKAVFFGWRSSENNSTATTSENINGSNSEKSSSFLSVGLEYQCHFLREKDFNLYAVIGARSWYNESTNPTEKLPSSSIDNTYSLGVGIGVEYRISRLFVVNAEVGFAHKWMLERRWETKEHKQKDEVTGEEVITYYKEHKRNYSTAFAIAGGIGIGIVF